MSRSTKKNPIIKDNGKSNKKDKQIINRALRRKINNPDFELSDGNAYKKVYESWNIADYVCRWTREEAIEYYNDPDNVDIREKYPTLEEWLNQWEKMMLRK